MTAKRHRATRVALAALLLASAAGAQQTSDLAKTRVLVSRREVRVLFPAETASRWGWTAGQTPNYLSAYDWSMHVSGIDGPRSIALDVRGDPRAFSSLWELVASTRPGVCESGMIIHCDPAHVTARVEGRRVVLTLRDSAQIVRMFGLRQPWVGVSRARPGEPRVWRDSVRVTYVAPQIATPDSTFRAMAAQARRRFEASIHRVSRSIRGAWSGDGRTAWIAVGDTATLRVDEMRCTYDSCSDGFGMTSVAGWSVADTTVAALHEPSDREPIELEPRAIVTGRRPGRTTVRVVGIQSELDSIPTNAPPERELSLDLLVTLPLDSVRIAPRPPTARVGDTVTFRARAFDREGREVAGAPIEFVHEGGRYSRMGHQAMRIRPDTATTQRVIARLGKHADTVVVRVTP